MPKYTIPALASVARASSTDEKKKLRGLLSAVAALFGLPDKATAKMVKVTEKYSEKHEKVEESDEEADEEEDEEESDAADDEEDESSTGSTDGSEEDEEEEEEEDEEEEEANDPPPPPKEKGALTAKQARAALAAADAAFIASLPAPLRASASIRTPSRLLREVRKATGASSLDGAMTAISRLRKSEASADAKAIRATAQLAERVAKVEATTRGEKVDAMIAAAKAAGRAPTKELRAQLRKHGTKHGTEALAELIASLPVVAVSNERTPRSAVDGSPEGLPSASDQEKQIIEAMTAGRPEKERAEIIEIFREKKRAQSNGAGGAGRV